MATKRTEAEELAHAKRLHEIRVATFRRALDTGQRVTAQRLVVLYNWSSEIVEDELAQLHEIRVATFRRALDAGQRVTAQRLVVLYNWSSEIVEDELAQWLFQE